MSLLHTHTHTHLTEEKTQNIRLSLCSSLDMLCRGSGSCTVIARWEADSVIRQRLIGVNTAAGSAAVFVSSPASSSITCPRDQVGKKKKKKKALMMSNVCLFCTIMSKQTWLKRRTYVHTHGKTHTHTHTSYVNSRVSWVSFTCWTSRLCSVEMGTGRCCWSHSWHQRSGSGSENQETRQILIYIYIDTVYIPDIS